MSGELQYYGDPSIDSGRTVIAKVYDPSGVQVGGDVSCAEVDSLAIYIGDMPTASSGRYRLRFFDGSIMLAQGEIIWDGTQEIIPGLTPIDGDISEIEAQRIILSALAGKVSGAGTSEMRFRDIADTKDRIYAVVDTDGNRKEVELDGE